MRWWRRGSSGAERALTGRQEDRLSRGVPCVPEGAGTWTASEENWTAHAYYCCGNRDMSLGAVDLQ